MKILNPLQRNFTSLQAESWIKWSAPGVFINPCGKDLSVEIAELFPDLKS
jgi:hypothetical protein